MFAPDTRTAPATSLIDRFTGSHAWLSNFYDSPLQWQGLWYPTAEAAFQAGKTLDQNLRQQFADAPTPGLAKQLGRRIRLRPHWDTVRHLVMAEVLAAKFAIPSFAARLKATGTALLVEGNHHHDQDWGCCRCERHNERPGHNFLGLELMRRRAHLLGADPTQWTRVAATGHRPHKIPGTLRGWVRDELTRIATKLIASHATEVAISGLAMGSDLWWAQAAHAAGARIWGYSPYPEQDQRWPQVWKDTRQEVIRNAEHVAHLGAGFDNALLHRRNWWMIRDAHALVAVVDSTRTDGGTVAAVRTATGRIPIIRVDLHTQEVRLVQPLVDLVEPQ